MPGSFVFELKSRIHFDAARFAAALRDIRKIRVPPEVYCAFEEQGGVALVVRVHKRQEWHLILPLDPTCQDIDCSFTYGIVSRVHVWEFVRAVLTTLCAACPLAFDFSYEDRDCEEVTEVGHFDYRSLKFVVKHLGLPSAEDIERASCMACQQQAPHRSAQYLQVVRQMSK